MAFRLEYPSNCEDCGQDMSRGTQAYYVGDGIVHYPRCPPKTEACNKCFMIPCECE